MEKCLPHGVVLPRETVPLRWEDWSNLSSGHFGRELVFATLSYEKKGIANAAENQVRVQEGWGNNRHLLKETKGCETREWYRASPVVVRSETHLCAYPIITWSGSTKLAWDVYAAIEAGAIPFSHSKQRQPFPSSNALSLHVVMLLMNSLPLVDAAAAEIDPCPLSTLGIPRRFDFATLYCSYTKPLRTYRFLGTCV